MIAKIQDSVDLNYPDILGLITQGQRLNLGPLQCAVATQPARIAAGQKFDVIFLVQNASDVRLDVGFTLKMPEADASGQSDMFYCKGTRIVKSLQAAEVGYFVVPAASSPLTKPDEYSLSGVVEFNVLDRYRKPERVREAEGGGAVQYELLSEAIRRELIGLRMLHWGVKHTGLLKRNIETRFEIVSQQVGTPPKLDAAWRSLWTLNDYVDEDIMEQRIAPQLDRILAFYTNNRPQFYELLQKTVTSWFNASGYPLYEGEARYIAKLLTHVLCDIGKPQPTREVPDPPRPLWYQQLLSILFQDPNYSKHPLHLIQQRVFPELVQDAMLHGFKMLETVLHEDFGLDSEKQAYTQDIIHALRNQEPLSYSDVYLPMIIAGLILNGRVVSEGENVRESLFSLHNAHQKRADEYNEDNAFITKMLETWIDDALDNC